ncbi:MAG: beta-lactamase family protein, partial [Methylobacteriaceae bacterium]|nr:beta-lactamase family protein [Methylobacteriaceae bacterium]
MNETVRTAQFAEALAEPQSLGLSASGLDRLRRVLRREIDEKRLPGAVAMIARKGELGFLEAFGVQDPASGTRMQTDSIFRIYSMTKPVVSVAVMMLVEEGQILLADPLSKYVPAFADPKVAVEREDGRLDLIPAERPITIQDLLRHTSGLTYEFVEGGAVQRMYMERGLASPNQTNADQVERLASVPLFNQPGRQWDYSRSTDVLGRII